MSQHIHYFDRDTWITDDTFHCNSEDIVIRDIKDIYINFKVNTAVASFLAFLISIFLLGAACVHSGNTGYWFLLPLIATFCWMRYTLMTYIEVWITTDKTRKMLVTGMRKRRWAYEIEDYIKHQLSLLED